MCSHGTDSAHLAEMAAVVELSGIQEDGSGRKIPGKAG
jgi:hypothetical protein